MDSKDFRKHAHDMVDWMADYMEGGVRDYPVKPDVEPGAVKAMLQSDAPIEGEDFAAIFKDFTEIAVPNITHWQHPRFFGYFPANGSPPSLLAEMLTATLGVNAMMWETSPAATEMEERVMGWLRDICGLPSTWQGVIQDTASGATLCALLAAREKASNWASNQAGMQAQPLMTVYCNGEAHSSVEKAMKIIGLGADALRRVPVDELQSMIPEALEAMVEEDIAAGHRPIAVVATVGTTGTGASDPLDEIGEVAAAHDLYYHVDAAWAGSAMICPEFRHLIKGLEVADSYVFNPHKWLMTNFDCSAHYMKEPELLTRSLSILPEYLKTKDGDAVNNYRDWGVPLGRRFRALKLWFVIRSYGVSGLQAIVRNHVAWGEELASVVAADDDFALMTGPNLSLITFAYAPASMDADAAEIATKALVEKVNKDGFTYITRTILDGRSVIRFPIGQTNCARADVMDSWARIKALATS